MNWRYSKEAMEIGSLLRHDEAERKSKAEYEAIYGKEDDEAEIKPSKEQSDLWSQIILQVVMCKDKTALKKWFESNYHIIKK